MKYSKLDLGTIEAVFNKLGGIHGAHALLRDEIEMRAKDLTIDLDNIMFRPRYLELVEHCGGGQMKWDPSAVEFYVDELQTGKRVTGHQLLKILADKPVLNICVMDFLLKRQHLIPEEWNDKCIFFWGTIYCEGGKLYVICMRMSRGEWTWSSHPLDNPWGINSPAILRKTWKEAR